MTRARQARQLKHNRPIRYAPDPQIPESSCLTTWLNEPQVWQVFCTAVWSVVGMAPTISPCLSTNSSAKPPDACHAMWQWVSQVPGLSSLNAMARYYCPTYQQSCSRWDVEIARADRWQCR